MVCKRCKATVAELTACSICGALICNDCVTYYLTTTEPEGRSPMCSDTVACVSERDELKKSSLGSPHELINEGGSFNSPERTLSTAPHNPSAKDVTLHLTADINHINHIRTTIIEAFSSPETAETSVDMIRKELAELLNNPACDPHITMRLAERYAQCLEDKLLDRLGLMTIV